MAKLEGIAIEVDGSWSRITYRTTVDNNLNDVIGGNPEPITFTDSGTIVWADGIAEDNNRPENPQASRLCKELGGGLQETLRGPVVFIGNTESIESVTDWLTSKT